MKKLASILIVVVFLFSSCNILNNRNVIDEDFSPDEKGQINVSFTVDKKEYSVKNACSSNILPAYFFQFEVQNDNCTELRLPHKSHLQYRHHSSNSKRVEFSAYNIIIPNKKLERFMRLWKDINTIYLSEVLDDILKDVPDCPKIYNYLAIVRAENIIIKFN